MIIQSQRRNDKPVTDDDMAEAVRVGEALAAQTPRAFGVQYLPEIDMLLLRLEDGVAIGLPVANYPEFADLTPAQLDRVAVGFHGQALRLDEADLHVSIGGLIKASASVMNLAQQLTRSSQD